MFKKLRETASATWAVIRNKDVDKPVKKRKPSKTDVQKRDETLAKQKAEADKRKEPWVTIVDMDVDYNDLSNGNFELDWNDYFIAKLMRFGYQGKEDADLVDQWFTDVCRNVVLETFEQEQADPQNRKLDGGRREYR